MPKGKWDDNYRPALICKMGHVVDDRARPEKMNGQQHCPWCGLPVIHECPRCHTLIRGYAPRIHGEGYIMRVPPQLCHNCGEFYPWLQEALVCIDQLTAAFPGLSATDRQELKKNLQNVLVSASCSQTTLHHIKALAAKIDNTWGWGILAETLKDLVSEEVSVCLGLAD